MSQQTLQILAGGVPGGGSSGQILGKVSGTAYDVAWQAPGLTQTQADLRYLQLGGGTLTGLLTLSGDPSTALQAATKQYADTKLTQAQADALYQTPAQAAALYLPLTGGTLTGNLLFSADSTRDIGASGANRPRDLYVGRSLVVSGTGAIGGNPSSAYGLYIAPAALTSVAQIGLFTTPVFSSASTTSGSTLTAQIQTQAATFTMANGYDILAAAPLLGAGSSVTSMHGLRVNNQGSAQVANAYGILIVNQTGATTTNVGLRNQGTTLLERDVSFGTSATPPLIKIVGSNSLSIENTNQFAMIGGKGGGYVNGNAYWDGTNWNRYDVAQAATYLFCSPGGFTVETVAAGANPITWTTRLSVGSNGNLTVNSNQGNATIILSDTNHEIISSGNTMYFYEWSGWNWSQSGGGATNRMTLDSGGNLVVNNDVACASVTMTRGSNQVIYWRDGSHYMQYAPAGDLNQLYWTHNFRAGGTITGNGAYINSASSERIKRNILTLDGARCLAQVQAVRPVSFEYIPLIPHWTPDRLGFISEDVAATIPQAASPAEGITAEALISVLWGAVQELAAQVQELRA